MGRFSIEAIFKAIDRVTAPMGKMTSAVSKFAKTARSDLKGVADKLDVGLGAKLTAGVAFGAAGASAAVYNVVGAGMAFEEAISAVGAVSLMTRDQIADLEKRAIELGGSTKFSATEVANAMEMMGRAGFTNAQTLSGIEGILNAAAAEGAGLAETASTVSNVLKGMGLATEESGRVADVLALASARTNSSITSLGDSMKTLGPVTKQFNIPLEDSVAMVALLQDVGLDASSAGTSAASALTKLAKPTRRAQQQMAKFGISFKDANGNMKPATAIFGEMAKAVQKSGGNMEAAAFFAELVGLESQKAAINLTNAFKSGAAADLIEELEGARGSAEKMAKLRMDNLAGDWEQLGGAVDSVKIALFQTQGAPLRGVVQQMTKWVELNQGLIVQDVSRFIADAIPVARMFAEGISHGAQSVGRLLQSVLGVTGPIENLFGSGSGQRMANVFRLGELVVKGSVAFVAFSGAVKVAQGTLLVFELASKGVTAALWISKTALGAARGAVILYQTATKAGVGATIAMSLGQKALAIDLAASRVAALAAATSFGTMAAAAGVAAAAVGALMLVNAANEELKGTTGGLGFFDTIGEMYDRGTWDPFKAIDERQNEIARRKAESRQTIDRAGGLPEPMLVSPQDRTARTIEEKTETVKTELTIKAPPGTVEVTKKPPGNAPVRLRLGVSGAF